MEINYEMKVKSIRTTINDNLTDFVVIVEWERTGTDELGFKGKTTGLVELDTTLKENQSFTPFEQLTEQEVLNWIENYYIEEWGTMDGINQPIIMQIMQQRNPIVEKRLPWLG